MDCYPWGPEALERAGAADKPILLSVGYAACHRCRAMAHESFEDPETAAGRAAPGTPDGNPGDSTARAGRISRTRART